LAFTEHAFLLYSGILLYVAGILLYAASLFAYAITEYHKPVTEGPYKFSRHPVYFSFFIIILASSMATANVILAALSVVHIFIQRKIAKAEEEQCLVKYGKAYKEYEKNTKSLI
jgi:protein-S-isoprenylcysteine O-methyltransferase Ste14